MTIFADVQRTLRDISRDFEADKLERLRDTLANTRLDIGLFEMKELLQRLAPRTDQAKHLLEEVEKLIGEHRQHRVNVPPRDARAWADQHEALHGRAQEILDRLGRAASRDELPPASDASRGLTCTIGTLSVSEQFSLSPCQFALAPGQILGIVGANGSGKTTLLKVLSGQLAAKGEVTLNGAQNYRREYMSKVAFVPQRPEPWTGRVSTHLAWRAALAGQLGANNETAVREMLAWCRLQAEADHTAVQLSGGQQMRVAIAAALIAAPELVILDEPLAPLDAGAQLKVLAVLRRRTRQWRNVMTVLSSQHIPEVELVADQVHYIEAGKLVPHTDLGKEVFEIAPANDGPAFDDLVDLLRRTAGPKATVLRYATLEHHSVLIYAPSGTSLAAIADCIASADVKGIQRLTHSKRREVLESHVSP